MDRSMPQLVYRNNFVEPTWGERDTQLLQYLFSVCACIVRALCILASVWLCSGHNSTFRHGFQNNLEKLFSQMSSSAIRNICSGSLEVKVTLEDQMINSCTNSVWYMFVHALCVRLSDFVRVIPCTFVHGFQNNWHSWCPRGVRVPFETFVQVAWRSRSHMMVRWSNGHKMSLSEPSLEH